MKFRVFSTVITTEERERQVITLTGVAELKKNNRLFRYVNS